MFRVASGLDSMVLGEPQILSQIRDALEAARAAGSVGPYLQRLATDALKIGKRARTDTDIARNKLSISHAAVELASRRRPDLANQRVTLVGAGKMASIAARVLRSRGVQSLTIVNRSIDRATDLAAQTGAQVRPINELESAIAESDIVISAIAADVPVITVDRVGERRTPLLLIDLAVPRAIEDACSALPGVELHDVDALEQVAAEVRLQYADEMLKVETLVHDATDAYTEWTQSRQASAAIGRLRAHAETIRDSEVERALRRLGHLSDRDRNVVRALAKGLTNTLMHEPVRSLRSAGSSDDISDILGTFGVSGDDSESS
jgi:glutamyl-tRNA reductase